MGPLVDLTEHRSSHNPSLFNAVGAGLFRATHTLKTQIERRKGGEKAYMRVLFGFSDWAVEQLHHRYEEAAPMRGSEFNCPRSAFVSLAAIGGVSGFQVRWSKLGIQSVVASASSSSQLHRVWPKSGRHRDIKA